jgi:hypothetical protein
MWNRGRFFPGLGWAAERLFKQKELLILRHETPCKRIAMPLTKQVLLLTDFHAQLWKAARTARLTHFSEVKLTRSQQCAIFD